MLTCQVIGHAYLPGDWPCLPARWLAWLDRVAKRFFLSFSAIINLWFTLTNIFWLKVLIWVINITVVMVTVWPHFGATLPEIFVFGFESSWGMWHTVWFACLLFLSLSLWFLACSSLFLWFCVQLSFSFWIRLWFDGLLDCGRVAFDVNFLCIFYLSDTCIRTYCISKKCCEVNWIWTQMLVICSTMNKLKSFTIKHVIKHDKEVLQYTGTQELKKNISKTEFINISHRTIT